MGHISSAWCGDDDDAGHHQPHQPHWHYHHLPSAHLGEVKAVNVIIKGSPPPPLDVTQFFFQHRHLERHKSKFNKISSDSFSSSKPHLPDIVKDAVEALEGGQVHHGVNPKLVPQLQLQCVCLT